MNEPRVHEAGRTMRASRLPFSPSPLLPFFLCTFFLTLLTGCGGSLSKAQVDRIRIGMKASEVEDILGKGKSVEGSEVQKLLQSSMPVEGQGPKAEMDASELRGLHWGDNKKSVTVIFRGDRVFRVFPQGLDK